MKYDKLFWRGLLWAVFSAGLLAILLFWNHAATEQRWVDLRATLLTIGHLCGLIGAYLLLWQLILRARLRLLEEAWGMELINELHRWNGYAAFGLIFIHPFLLSFSYAIVDRASIVGQFIDFILHFTDVLWAFLGWLAIIAVVVFSISIVRRKLKYELWYLVHLLTYAAILLVFFHQLRVGPDFIRQVWFVRYWYALYLTAFGSILIFRFGVPLYRLWRHRFRVMRVERETHNVISIYLTGRQLDRIPVQPGQFMIWRFLDGERWWQAHPFSLSAAPNGTSWRLTIKASGDFTSRLPEIRPGTLVIVDGPHGKFILPKDPSAKLLMIAGGVGITPLRAMLDTVGPRQEVTLLYACRTRADKVFEAELAVLSKQKNLKVHYVLSADDFPADYHGHIDAAMIRNTVPDYASHEIYLCGPLPMMEEATNILKGLGVKASQVHSERFVY